MASVFVECETEILMCFYHVIAKVHERTRYLLPGKRSLIVADIFDMNYARNASEFHAKKTSAVRRWFAEPDVEQFGEYFLQQWLTGTFVKWQYFRTPVGWATTNNPMETFNAKLKKNYTLQERMLMGSLLGQLQVCCRMESVSGAEFHEKSTASSRLRRRATTLRRQRLLVETPSFDGSSNFVLVVSKATPRIYVKPKRKSMDTVDVAVQLGANTARMERDEQPEEGWSVDLTTRTWACKYFFHKRPVGTSSLRLLDKVWY
ncbi:hypothetical protein F441_15893 [Phytophthora nicotianae CJ01A1]|uniref:MULE transposase domain-containing protein n=1 Tax=Phytophthora nicotianae CJ01A1 TaxID=1317063 RepID=W2WD65_PHYNI|nr:hypothetical protein F441_15893 [Phytophthora nicotianae CJ01A1]